MPKSRKPESYKLVEPKETHTETHYNKMSNAKYKERILKSTKEKQNETFFFTKNKTSIRLQTHFSADTLKSQYIKKAEIKTNLSQEHPIWQNYHSELKTT